MVYDIQSHSSFEELRRRFLPLLPAEKCLKVVVGAKIDKVSSDSDRQVTKQEAREFCGEINAEFLTKFGGARLPFYETSSKTGENVKETFEYIFEQCLSALSDEYRIQDRGTLTLHSTSPQPENTDDKSVTTKKKCCSS